MDRLRVLVHGGLGRMGQEVLKAVNRDPELEAVAAVDIKASSEFISIPEIPGPIPLSADLESSIIKTHPEVLADFTVPGASIPAARMAAKHGVRIVVGTTGLSSADRDEIKALFGGNRLGAVVAPNFAIAAVVMMHLSKIASRYFEYAEIVELHHEQKLDAPSGTAIATAQEMVRYRGKPFKYASVKHEAVEHSRGGQIDGIAIHSVRLPGMLAHQEVILGAPGQTLRIRLDQINREAFMPGVILAIKKVVDMNEPIFGLEKLLGL